MAHFLNDKNQFVKDFEILSYDCDKHQNLKISSALKFFQVAADEHCSIFNADYLKLRERGIAFVLVKTSVTVHTTPVLYDKIKVITWHKGSKGMQYFRDYVIQGQSGETLVECGTAWVIVDIHTHKMMKPSDVRLDVTEGCCRDAKSRLVKTRMPDLEPAGVKKVEYTEIDGNNHLTNWVYADIVTNFIPEFDGKRIAEMDITFSSEAYMGENIEIFRKQCGEEFFLSGFHNRGKCFEARCIVETNGAV